MSVVADATGATFFWMYRVWLATKATLWFSVNWRHSAVWARLAVVRAVLRLRLAGGCGGSPASRHQQRACWRALWPPRIEPAPDPPNHPPRCDTRVNAAKSNFGSAHTFADVSGGCGGAPQRIRACHRASPTSPVFTQTQPTEAAHLREREGDPPRTPGALPAQPNGASKSSPKTLQRVQNFRTSMPCFCKA